MWERDGGRCYVCGEPVRWQEYNADHVVPFSRGGQDTVANLRVTHGRCNSRRGTREVAVVLHLQTSRAW